MRRLLGETDEAGFFRPSCLFSLIVLAAALVPWLAGWWLILCEVTRWVTSAGN